MCIIYFPLHICIFVNIIQFYFFVFEFAISTLQNEIEYNNKKTPLKYVVRFREAY